MERTIESAGRRLHVFRKVRWAVIFGLLILPAVAMQFTDDVKWTMSDFAFMAILLIGAGVTFEVAAPRVGKPARRALMGAAVVGVVLLIWVEAAVGVFH